jgi:hypothetical protein
MIMTFREKKLYHQIHPLKLATDIGVTFPFLYFLYLHEIILALLVGFIPPIIVSSWMMIWPPDLERIKNSRFGGYIKKYITPIVETIRLLTLAPMAYGAWFHEPIWILVGVVILVLAWCNGLVWKKKS